MASACFNRVWELLEQPGRTAGQDDEMLHGAHASRALCAGMGTTANLVRGEWQCADAEDRELVATDLKNVRALL